MPLRSLRSELPQHVLKDAAVLVVLDLLWRIETRFDAEGLPRVGRDGHRRAGMGQGLEGRPQPFFGTAAPGFALAIVLLTEPAADAAATFLSALGFLISRLLRF